jgi:hypothetical protein
MEQAVGYENWKSFHTLHDGLVQNNQLRNNAVQTATNKVKLVLLSDQSIYRIIEKNKSCFKPKFLADNREDIDINKRTLEAIETLLSRFRSMTTWELQQTAPDAWADWIKIAYDDFYDWKTGKRLNK